MDQKRNKGIYLKLTPEELDLIDRALTMAKITNRSAYIRKMAITGRIIMLDIPQLEEITRLLKITANNVNQIAKLAHSTGKLYDQDVKGLVDETSEIRRQFGALLDKLSHVQNA